MFCSILDSVKKTLGIGSADDSFDQDIIMHINTVLANLVQMGVGPKEGFAISDNVPVWEDFIGESPKMSQVQTYVYLKVKMLFDPPTSSTLLESTNRMASELEWRLYSENGGF